MNAFRLKSFLAFAMTLGVAGLTPSPTFSPTPPTNLSPTVSPTATPTALPTSSPTGLSHPTSSPTATSTSPPTAVNPTASPTLSPKVSSPTANPTSSPTASSPTANPTSSPTASNPTATPTSPPTASNPTATPTSSPTASNPTSMPTSSPTASNPTSMPTSSPTASNPTSMPTSSPTASNPTASPTTPRPTLSPTAIIPTSSPTPLPTYSPTSTPTAIPTMSPTSSPTTATPTRTPTLTPTEFPTTAPTASPTQKPSTAPTRKPTLRPTRKPTCRPTHFPTRELPPPRPRPFSHCFSEANFVEVEGKGSVPLKNLQIGDHVVDAAGKFTRVYGFGHFSRHLEAEYLQFDVEGLLMPLEMTKDHLVFVGGKAVPASSVQVGDHVDVVPTTAPAKVNQIRAVLRQGAYAPFTTSGTILVSGVAASSYVTLQHNADVLVLGDRYKTSLSMHWLSHVFQTPHRMICTAEFLGMSNYCKKYETYNDDGISKWVEGPYQVSRWLLQQNGVVVVAVLFPLFVVAATLYAVEVGWMYFMTAVVGAVFIYIWHANKSQKKIAA